MKRYVATRRFPATDGMSRTIWMIFRWVNAGNVESVADVYAEMVAQLRARPFVRWKTLAPDPE